MNGKLVKDRYKLWCVEFEDVTWEDNRHEKFTNSIPVHPDDLEMLLNLEKNFDSIESRILLNPNVEFEIVTNQKLSGIVEYAKLK